MSCFYDRSCGAAILSVVLTILVRYWISWFLPWLFWRHTPQAGNGLQPADPLFRWENGRLTFFQFFLRVFLGLSEAITPIVFSGRSSILNFF